MWLSLGSAVLVIVVHTAFGQSRPNSSDCLSNKDCPSDRLCAEYKCINPCLLNLCGDTSNCKVTNHIPVCACKGSFSGPLAGGSSTKSGKKKYQLVMERRTWLEALVHCSSQGMRLATIESQDEQERIVNQIKQSDQGDYKTESINRRKWWIGGSDLHKRSDFIWFSSGQPIKYKNFPNGQPDGFMYGNGEIERCLELPEEWNYRWNDYRCEHGQYFICEYFE